MTKDQNKFLEHFARLGMLTAAARAAGIASSKVHYWLRTDKVFAAAYAEAQEEAITAAEDELYRRAVHGVEKPVYYKGEEVGRVTDYSDQLLTFFLKAARPEKYRERADVRVTGEVDLAAAIRARRKALNVDTD